MKIKKNNKIKENFSFCLDLFKQSKIKVVVTSVFLVIAILTGIIVALKTYRFHRVGENSGFTDISSGGLTTTFFSRFLSYMPWFI